MLYVDELGDVRLIVAVVGRHELAHLAARALHVHARAGQVRLHNLLSSLRSLHALNRMKMEKNEKLTKENRVS